jgi:hypothetical protein
MKTQLSRNFGIFKAVLRGKYISMSAYIKKSAVTKTIIQK